MEDKSIYLHIEDQRLILNGKSDDGNWYIIGFELWDVKNLEQFKHKLHGAEMLLKHKVDN